MRTVKKARGKKYVIEKKNESKAFVAHSHAARPHTVSFVPKKDDDVVGDGGFKRGASSKCVVKEYDTTLDSKKRVTIRQKTGYEHYHITEYANGVVIMEPRELNRPDAISVSTLKSIHAALKNLDKGIVGPEVDFDKYKKYLSEEDDE